MSVSDWVIRKAHLLLEEYKIGWDVYYNSEKEYSNRENFFLAVLTLIAGITIQLFFKNVGSVQDLILFGKIFSLIGMIFSLFWLFMQFLSAALSKARIESLKKIENLLSNPSDAHPNRIEFGFLNRTEKFYSLTNFLGINNSTFRLLLPVLFFILFLIFMLKDIS